MFTYLHCFILKFFFVLVLIFCMRVILRKSGKFDIQKHKFWRPIFLKVFLMRIVQLCSPKVISNIWLKSFLLGSKVGHFENYLHTMYRIPSRSSYGFPSCSWLIKMSHKNSENYHVHAWSQSENILASISIIITSCVDISIRILNIAIFFNISRKIG